MCLVHAGVFKEVALSADRHDAVGVNEYGFFAALYFKQWWERFVPREAKAIVLNTSVPGVAPGHEELIVLLHVLGD